MPIESTDESIKLKNSVKKFIAENPTITEGDNDISDYCLAIWMTLDRILPSRSSWNMEELEIPRYG